MKNLLILLLPFIILTMNLWEVVHNAELLTTTSNKTVFLRSNAILKISLKNGTTDIDLREISCDVTLNGRTRQLGDWTTSLSTASILKETDDIQLIFDHRLTGSYIRNEKEITISISNATFTDSGIYRCACNRTLSSVHLEVVGGPIVHSDGVPAEVSLNEGTSKAFDVVYCGNPAPKVAWTLKGVTTEVEGKPVNSSIDITMENLLKFGLEKYCYIYTYTTPAIFRDSCNLTATYNVLGKERITGQVSFSASFTPEILTGIQTVRTEKCLLTKWNGPKVGPNFCRVPIVYDVQLIPATGSPILVKSYSTTFEVCKTSFDIGTISAINVRYANKYGKGEYAPTIFVEEFTKLQVKAFVPAKDDDTTGAESVSFKSIAISTSSVLGLFLLVVMVFIIYYAIVNCACKCCKRAKKLKEEKGEEPPVRASPKPYVSSPKPYVVTEMKSPARAGRKNRIRKENIVHKPQALSEVTANTLVKSNTFSGFDSLANRHADEVTLQKGYMPLNTLQRRISESLQADYLMQPKRASNLPIFEDIFENPHVEEDEEYEDSEDSKRNSGASAATECTSLGSRTTLDTGGVHLTVGRTTSLESTISDYDMPYHINLERNRRKSIYDLPRSQTFHGGNRPNSLAANRKSSEGADTAPLDFQDGSRYGSEYALPNVTPRVAENEDNHISMYSLPRKSIGQPPLEQYDEPTTRVIPNDDLVIYDRPRISIIPEKEIYDQPKERKYSFEAPVPSQVFGIYDTPKMHGKIDHEFPIERSTSIESNSSHNNVDNADNNASAQKTINNSGENFYDNLNHMLTKNGVNQTTPDEDSFAADIFNEIAKQDHSVC